MQIGVIGAGQMGHGIAQVCATNGNDVVLCDNSAEQLTKAEAQVKKSVQKLYAKGKLNAEEQEGGLSNIKFSSSLATMKDCELIVEAVSENEQLKQTLMQELDKIVNPAAIFASNTSSIPITRLATCTSRPAQVIGMHFMNPVPLMRLVEIIPTALTAQETQDKVVALASAIGKETIISKDYAGFVVNRLLMPMINEAFDALMCGVASAEDIDKGMRLGTNQPMGVLALADFIGLDTCYAIMQTLYRHLGDQRYRPSPLLAKYVEAGTLGRKTGQGVYVYEGAKPLRASPL